jgi:hypothetical protein
MEFFMKPMMLALPAAGILWMLRGMRKKATPGPNIDDDTSYPLKMDHSKDKIQ